MSTQKPLTWFGGRPGAFRAAEPRLHLLTALRERTFCGWDAGTMILVTKPSQVRGDRPWCETCLREAQAAQTPSLALGSHLKEEEL